MSDFRVLYKLFRHREDGGRSETALAPFFTVSRDDEKDWSSLSVLWPLFAWERDGERSEVRLFHFIRFGS